MAKANMEIIFVVVWWFFLQDFGVFTIDKFDKEDLEGIVHQLHAQNLGIM